MLSRYVTDILKMCMKKFGAEKIFISPARATENRFFAGLDRFLVCKTDSVCIKRIFFRSEKIHFADHTLAQLPGLVKCQTVNCP